MAALHAMLSDGNLVDHLLWVMLGLRSAPKEDLDASPAELVFAHPLYVPGKLLSEGSIPSFFPVGCQFLSDSTPSPPPVHHCVQKLFRFVFAWHKVHHCPPHPHDGPFRVLDMEGCREHGILIGLKLYIW